VIDRLHAGYLGAYGNTWIETPAFDRLAAESFVLDQALTDASQLEAVYRSYWHGWHALGGPVPEDRATLPGLLREAGVTTVLMTDDRTVAQHRLAVDFDEVIQIDPPWQIQQVADDAFEQSHLGRCFAEIIDWLENARSPFMLWCHLASLGTIWDAPPEFRRRYWVEGDPEPSDSAEVPDRMLREDVDPDELLVHTQAYAAQVSLLDTCLGGLWDVLEESDAARDTMLVLTSPRGFPLGEHRRLGPCDDALYAELVQVPLILRFPDGLGAADRSQALVEPSDLWATMLDVWRVPAQGPSPSGATLMPLVRDEVVAIRDRLVIAGQGAHRAIRTPAWHLVIGKRPELFLKPDDRWEVNNVAVRCQDVVESLEVAAVEYEQTIFKGRAADLPPLSDVLIQGLG
jgi:arylsulfatase A-like enzyme